MEKGTSFRIDLSVDPSTLDYLVMDHVTKEATSSFQYVNSTEFVGVLKGTSATESDMPCQCSYKEGEDPEWKACGDKAECINRLIQMECHPLLCPTGRACQNRRFQKKLYSKVRVGYAGQKGYGLYTEQKVDSGQFVIEYTGEMVTTQDFVKRTHKYGLEGQKHHYFMSVDQHQVIDATVKGNVARFINHSCNPNCALQRWIVAGQTRMGIFALRRINIGEELSFDYKFERFEGSEPQKCFCGDKLCKGIIGVTKEIKETFLKNYSGGESDKDLDLEIEEESVTKEQQEILKHDFPDSDDDSEYVNSEDESDDDRGHRNYHGLHSSEEVLKLVQIMLRSTGKKRHILLITSKLLETKNKKLLSIFVSFHGLRILRLWLLENADDETVIIPVLQCIDSMPIKTKNTIIENKIEPVVTNLCRSKDEFISNLACQIINKWSSLKNVYKIPKRKPGESVKEINLPNLSNQVSTFLPNKVSTPKECLDSASKLSKTSSTHSVLSPGNLDGWGALDSTNSSWNKSSEFGDTPKSDTPARFRNSVPPNHENSYSQKSGFGNGYQAGYKERNEGFGRGGSFSKARGNSRWNSAGRNYSNPSLRVESAWHDSNSGFDNVNSDWPSNGDKQTSYGDLSNSSNNNFTPNQYPNARNDWNSEQSGRPNSNNKSSIANGHQGTPVGSGKPRQYSNYKLKDGKKLKSGWYPAKSQDGKTYYYSESTKEVQWQPPYEDGTAENSTFKHKDLLNSGPAWSRDLNTNENADSDALKIEHSADDNNGKDGRKRVNFEPGLKTEESPKLSIHKKPKKENPLKAEAEKKKKLALEKKATNSVASQVVKILTRKSLDLDKDEFKHEAKKITKILVEKEKKSSIAKNKNFDPKSLIDLPPHKIKKIYDFVTIYTDKLAASKTTKDQPIK